MIRQLFVLAGADKGRSFPLPNPALITLGRSQLHADVQISDPQVSRVHCQIEVDGARVLLTDLDSASGTCVNGRRVERHELQVGDILRLGETQLRFQTEGYQPSAAENADKLGGKKVERLEELTGQTLAHFRVGPLLAKGRSGLVFRADDQKAHRPVALKVLWPEFSKNDEEMQRFVRAMKTMLPMQHPNLTALYGAGKSGGFCWVAMEFVEGESLAKLIGEAKDVGKRDWRLPLRVAIHLSRALTYAHAEQIVHRNVTPTNIILRRADQVAKLGDLMLAKALEGTLAEQITKPGELLGDVAYMSPERTRGLTVMDARSDLYSLGATVYALLAGKAPFEGLTLVDTITKIRQQEPAQLRPHHPSLPAPFESAVQKLLAKRPEDRIQTAAELLGELEKVAERQGVAV